MNSKLFLTLLVVAVACLVAPSVVEGTFYKPYYKSYIHYPIKHHYGGYGYGKGIFHGYPKFGGYGGYGGYGGLGYGYYD